MADNYLEKRMEDYRAGRTSSSSRKASRPVRMPSIAVAEGALSPNGRSIMSALTAQGCRVHFVDADIREGAIAAQQTGALFIPADSHTADNLRRLRPEGIDLDIAVAENIVALSIPGAPYPKGHIAFSEATSAAAIARAVIFLADRDVFAAEITL